MKNQERKKRLLLYLGTLIYFIVFILIGEAILHGSIGETISWAKDIKFAYLFNVLIMVSVFLLLLGLLNNYFVSFVITNCLILLMLTMNYFKFSFLGEFLYPWDLLLYDNVLNLLPNLYQEVPLKKMLAIIGLIILIISVISFYFLRTKRKRDVRLVWWHRILVVSISVFIMSTFTFYRSFPTVEYFFDDVVKVFNQPWNQNSNYKVNGFLVSFLFNTQSALVLQPKGYNEKNMQEIVGNLENKKVEKENTNDKNPNIVIIMNEALWDPTLMKTISFTPDPMPVIREHQSGWALSPMFGGGTSNVEFEVLTGLSNTFLPMGSVPYQQYIKESIPSIPNYLKEFGYQTMAIHPYPKWFWNREEVYEHLGFDRFIDIDEFDSPIYKGPYVSDHQVSRTIIEQTEQSEEPIFIFAVTMQNHTSYHLDRYEEYTVETSGDITDEINGTLKAYTQGVADADQALSELISYYEESNEPTVLVLFGDHLPTLGLEYDLYRQAGFLPAGKGEENWMLEDYRKMRSTPLVFWNNFEAPIPDIKTLSTSFIGLETLAMAGIEQPLFYSFLQDFQNKIPGYTREVKIDEENQLLKGTPKDFLQIENTYRLIQYDFLFGKQYTEQSLFPKGSSE